MDEDDDTPQLSAHTLAALQEFISEQQDIQKTLGTSTAPAEGREQLYNNDLNHCFPEDWQMSQFWYDEETCRRLADEVKSLAGEDGKAVCVSCPSVFRACGSSANIHLFEYDKRFDAFGSNYFFYDYNEPENIKEQCKAAYSVVIADPPFLSQECLEKLAVTVKILAAPEAKIILCTGVVMEKQADQLLSLKKTSFVPKHKNNLGNEFACYTNYDMKCKENISTI